MIYSKVYILTAIAVSFLFRRIYAAEVGLGTDSNTLTKPSAPIIDIYSIMSDSLSVSEGWLKTMEQMHQAASTYGAFIVVNHTFASAYMEAGLLAADALFSLPLEAKECMKFNQTHGFGRGYLSFGAESGLSSFFEPKEGYSYGYPFSQDREKDDSDYGWLGSNNRWPQELDIDAQHILEHFYLDFSQVAISIVKSLIRYRLEKLGQETIGMKVDGGEYISLMRIFHYFALNNLPGQSNADETQAPKNAIGSSPHTDWGLLTVILQNEITGLQFFYEKTSQWIDIPYIPNSLVINIGDYFSLATDKSYHSPIHRVTCPTDRDRTSFVYFFYPDFNSNLILPKPQASTEQLHNSDRSSDTKQHCDADGAPGECVSIQVNTPKVEFNTLTVSESENVKYNAGEEGESQANESDRRKQMTFGEYIMHKWDSVLRQK